MTNKIELVINAETEEVKTYLQPAFIKGSVIREGIKLGKELEKQEDMDDLIIDKMAQFVADKLYNNQFTADDLIDGLDARVIITELMNQVSGIFGDIAGTGKSI